jgi:hypothetical protein
MELVFRIIIAMAIYDVIKFVLSILFVMFNKNNAKVKKEIEIKTFQERLREVMESDKA